MTPDQRAKRLHYHLYESLEGITEHAERIVKLEELVADMWRSGFVGCASSIEEYLDQEQEVFDRMQELGIEP